MDKEKIYQQRAENAIRDASLRDNIQTYEEDTSGKNLTNDDLPRNVSEYQRKEFAKKQKENEQYRLQQEEENKGIFSKSSKKIMEDEGIDYQFKKAHEKVDTDRDKAIEIAEVQKRESDELTASQAREARMKANQQQQNFYNTEEYLTHYSQLGMMPTGMTNEEWFAINANKSLSQQHQEFALANYQQNQAAMKARQNINIQEAFGYERNLITFKANLDKIYIQDKYARKEIEKERERVRADIMGGIATQGLEGKAWGDLLSRLIVNSPDEGTYTTSRIDLALNMVADIADAFVSMIPNVALTLAGKDSIGIVKSLFATIGLTSGYDFSARSEDVIHEGTVTDYIWSGLRSGKWDYFLEGLAGTINYLVQMWGLTKGARFGLTKLMPHLRNLAGLTQAATAAGQITQAGLLTSIKAFFLDPNKIGLYAKIFASGAEGLGMTMRNALDTAHDRSKMLGIKPNGWADVSYDDWYYGAIGAGFDVIGIPIVGKIGEAAVKNMGRAFRASAKFGKFGETGILPTIRGGLIGTSAAATTLGVGSAVASGLEAAEEIGTMLAGLSATYGVDMSDLMMEILKNDPNNAEFNSQVAHTILMASGGAFGTTAGFKGINAAVNIKEEKAINKKPDYINQYRKMAQNIPESMKKEYGNINITDDMKKTIDDNVKKSMRMHDVYEQKINKSNIPQAKKEEILKHLKKQKSAINIIQQAIGIQHYNKPTFKKAMDDFTYKVQQHTNDFQDRKTPNIADILFESFEEGILEEKGFFQWLSKLLKEKITPEKFREKMGDTIETLTEFTGGEGEETEIVEPNKVDPEKMKQDQEAKAAQQANQNNQNGQNGQKGPDKGGDKGEGGVTAEAPKGPQTPNNQGGAANQAQKSEDSKDGEVKQALSAATAVGNSGLQSGGITNSGKRSKIPDNKKQKQAVKEKIEEYKKQEIHELSKILSDNWDKIYNKNDRKNNKRIDNIITNMLSLASTQVEDMDLEAGDLLVEEFVDLALRKEWERQKRKGNTQNKFLNPHDIEELISKLFKGYLVDENGKKLPKEEFEKIKKMFRKFVLNSGKYKGKKYQDGMQKLTKMQDKIIALKMAYDRTASIMESIKNTDKDFKQKLKKELEEQEKIIDQLVKEVQIELDEYNKFIKKLDPNSKITKELEHYAASMVNILIKTVKDLENSYKAFGKLTKKMKALTINNFQRDIKERSGLASYLGITIKNYLNHIKNFATRIIRHLISNIDAENFNTIKSNAVYAFKLMSGTFKELYNQAQIFESYEKTFKHMTKKEMDRTFYSWSFHNKKLGPLDANYIERMPTITFGAYMNNRLHARMIEHFTNFNKQEFDNNMMTIIINLAYPEDENQTQTKREQLRRLLSSMYEAEDVNRVLSFIKNNKNLDGGGAEQLAKLLSTSVYDMSYLYEVITAMIYSYLVNLGSNVTQAAGYRIPNNFKAIDTNFVQPRASFAVDETFEKTVGNLLDGLPLQEKALIKQLAFSMMTIGGKKLGTMSVESNKPSTVNKTTDIYNVFEEFEDGTLQDTINDKDDPKNKEIYNDLKNKLTKLDIWGEIKNEKDAENKESAINDIISFYAKDGNGLNYFKLLEKVKELESVTAKNNRGKAVKKNPFKEAPKSESSLNIIIINNNQSGILEIIQEHEDKMKKLQLEEDQDKNKKIRIDPIKVEKNSYEAQEIKKEIKKIKKDIKTAEKKLNEAIKSKDINAEDEARDKIRVLNNQLIDAEDRLDKTPYTITEESSMQGKQAIDENIDFMREILAPIDPKNTKKRKAQGGDNVLVTEEEYKDEMSKLKFGLNEGYIYMPYHIYIPNYKFVVKEKKDKKGNVEYRYIEREQNGYIHLSEHHAILLLERLGYMYSDSYFNTRLGITAEEISALEKDLKSISETNAFVEYNLEERAKGNKPTFYFDYDTQPSGRLQIADSVLTIISNRSLRHLFTNETNAKSLSRKTILKKLKQGNLTREAQNLYYTFAEILGYELSFKKKGKKYYVSYTEEQRKEIFKHVEGFLNNNKETNDFLENYIKQYQTGQHTSNSPSEMANLKDEELNRLFNANMLLQWNKSKKLRPNYDSLITHIDGPASGSAQKNLGVKGNPLASQVAFGRPISRVNPQDYFATEIAKAEFKAKAKEAKANGKNLTIKDVVDSLEKDYPYGNLLYELFQQMNKRYEEGKLKGQLTGIAENSNIIISALVDYLGLRNANEISPDEASDMRKKLRDLSKTIVTPIMFGADISTIFKSTNETVLMETLAKSVVEEIDNNLKNYEKAAKENAKKNGRENNNGVINETIYDYLYVMKQNPGNLSKSTQQVISKLLDKNKKNGIKGVIGNTNIKEKINEIFNDTYTVNNANLLLATVNYDIYNSVKPSNREEIDNINLFREITNQEHNLPFSERKKDFRGLLNDLLEPLKYKYGKKKGKFKKEKDMLAYLNKHSNKNHRLKRILLGAGYIYHDYTANKYKLNKWKKFTIEQFMTTYVKYYTKVSMKTKSTSSQNYFGVSIFHNAAQSINANMIMTEHAKKAIAMNYDIFSDNAMVVSYFEVFKEMGFREDFERINSSPKLDTKGKLKALKKRFNEIFENEYGEAEKSKAESMLQDIFVKKIKELMEPFYGEKQGTILLSKKANTNEITRFRKKIEKKTEEFAVKIYDKIITSINEEGKISTYTTLDTFNEVFSDVFPLIEHFNEAVNMEMIINTINPIFTIYDAGYIPTADFNEFARLWNEGLRGRINKEYAGNIIKTLATMVNNLGLVTQTAPSSYKITMIKLLANMISHTMFISPEYNAHIKYEGMELPTDNSVDIKDIRTDGETTREHLKSIFKAIQTLSGNKITIEYIGGAFNITMKEDLDTQTRRAITNMIDSIPFIVTHTNYFMDGKVIGENIIISYKDTLIKNRRAFPYLYKKLERLRSRKEYSPESITKEEQEFLDQHKDVDLTEWELTRNELKKLVNMDIHTSLKITQEEKVDIYESSYFVEALKETRNSDGDFHIVYFGDETEGKIRKEVLEKLRKANEKDISIDKIKIYKAKKDGNDFTIGKNISLTSKFLFINKKRNQLNSYRLKEYLKSEYNFINRLRGKAIPLSDFSGEENRLANIMDESYAERTGLPIGTNDKAERKSINNLIKKANKRAQTILNAKKDYVITYNRYPLDDIMNKLIEDLKTKDEKEAYKSAYINLLVLMRTRDSNPLHTPTIVLEKEIFGHSVNRDNFKDLNGKTRKFKDLENKLFDMLSQVTNREIKNEHDLSVEEIYNLSNINGGNYLSKAIKENDSKIINSLKNNKLSNFIFDDESQIDDDIAAMEEAVNDLEAYDPESNADKDLQSIIVSKFKNKYFDQETGEYTGPEDFKDIAIQLKDRGKIATDNIPSETEEYGEEDTDPNAYDALSEDEDTDPNAYDALSEDEDINPNVNNALSEDIEDSNEKLVESSEALSIKANQAVNGGQAISANAQSTNTNNGWTSTAKEKAINAGRVINRNEVNNALQRYVNSISNGVISSLIKKVVNAFMSVLSNEVTILVVPDSAMPGRNKEGATFTRTENGVQKQYIVVRESAYLQNNDILLHEIGHAAIGNAFSMTNFKGLNNIMSKFKALKGRVISKIHELYKTPQGREILKEMGLLNKEGHLGAIYDAMTNENHADEEFMMYFISNARRLEFLNDIAEKVNNNAQMGPIRSFLQAIMDLLKHALNIISLGTFFRDEINNPNKTLAESLVDISNSLVDYSTEASAHKAEDSMIQDVRDKINEEVQKIIDRIPLLNIFKDNKAWASRVKGYVTKEDYEKAKERIRQRIMNMTMELSDREDGMIEYYLGNPFKSVLNTFLSGFFWSPLDREVALEILNETLKASDKRIVKGFRGILKTLNVIDVDNLSEIEQLIGQKTALDKIINARVNAESQLMNDVFENMIGKDKIKELAENGKLEEVRRATQVFFATGMSSSPFVVRDGEEETNSLFDEEFKDNLHTLFFGDYSVAMDKVDESMDIVKEQIVNIINNREWKKGEKRATITTKDLSPEAVNYFLRQTLILGHQRIVGGTTNQGLQNVNSILSAIYNVHNKKENYLSQQNLTKDGRLRFMDLYTAMVRNVESKESSRINQNKELEIALYNLTTKQAIAAIKDEHPDDMAFHYTRFQDMINTLIEARDIKDEIPADFVNNAAYMARKFNTLNSVSLIKKMMRPTEENIDLYIKYVKEANKLGELYAQPRRDIDAINKQKEKVNELYEKVQEATIKDQFFTQDFRKDYSRDVYETYTMNKERKIMTIARLDTSEIPADVVAEYYKSTTKNQSTTDFKSAVIYNVRRGWKIADPRSNLPLEVNENDQIEYIDDGIKKTESLEEFIKVQDNITFIYDGLDISEDVTVAYLLLGNSFNNKGADLDNILHYSEKTKEEKREIARKNYDTEIKDLLDHEKPKQVPKDMKTHRAIPSTYKADPYSDWFKNKLYTSLKDSENAFRPIAGSHNKFRTQMSRIKFENLTGVDTSIMSVLTEMTRTDMTRKMQEEVNSQVINSIIKDNDRIINSKDSKLKKEVEEKYGIIYMEDFEAMELTPSERIIKASNRNKTALLAPSVLDQIASYVYAYNEGTTSESKKIKKLYVSPDILDLVQGIQHKSIAADLIYRLSGKDGILGNLAKDPKVVKFVEKAALWLHEGVNETKQNTVIINPKVLLSNAASQIMSLGALGISPKQILDDYITIKADIERFEDDAIALYQLQTNRDMLIKNSDLENSEVQDRIEEMNKQIAALTKQIENNRVYFPMSNGADTNIADETKQDNSLYTGIYKGIANQVLSKTGMKTIIKNLGYDPDNIINELSLSTTSWWYKKGQEINRYTDMIPKIMVYEKYRRDGLEPEDAMHKAQSMLINYNTPLESGVLRLLDRHGAIPFARYSIRVLPALVKAFTDRPVDTAITMTLSGLLELGASAIGIGSFFSPSIYNDAPTSLFGKITHPFRTTTDLRNVFRHAPFLDLIM